MFNTLVYQPLFSTLMFLSKTLGGSLGFAIIALTLLLRALLLPLTLPSLKSAQKIRDLKPELDKLKQKHGKNKAALQKAQLELYQKHGLNPAAGCLPNILQLVILITLYRVLISSLQNTNGFSTRFFWLDLAKPDQLYILPILAGVSQLILSLMLTPAIEHHPEKNKKATEQTQDMAEAMGQQMLFIMPVMTFVIALRFPSGLAVYWLVTTLFSIAQQYYLTGWGGLSRYVKKVFRSITP